MIDRTARRDVAVGVGTSVCTVVLNLLVVPVYVRFLGVEAYGLVGFLALLQGILALFDLGFAPTVSREVARGFGIGDHRASRALLATLARIYWLSAIAIAGIGAIVAPFLAAHWLNVRTLELSTVTDAIVLMALILAFRWPSGIYFGAVIGAHRVTAGNLVNLSTAVGTAVLGIIATYWFRRIEPLFMVNAAAAIIQVLAMRALAWRAVGLPTEAWSFAPLRTAWRYSAGMGLITLVAVLLTQADKLLVSKLLALQTFGLFSLANVVGRSLYQLTAPIYNVVYPRFSAQVATGDVAPLKSDYLQWSGLFCALFYPASLFLVLAIRPLLGLWLHNPVTADAVAPLASLIAIGASLHGAMLFPFALQVAHGDTRTPLTINVIVACVYVVLLIWLIGAYKAWGAAAAWPILMAIYVAIAVWLTHRKILPDIAWRWLVLEAGIPFLLCGLMGLATARFARGLAPISAIVIDMLVSAAALVLSGGLFLHRQIGAHGMSPAMLVERWRTTGRSRTGKRGIIG